MVLTRRQASSQQPADSGAVAAPAPEVIDLTKIDDDEPKTNGRYTKKEKEKTPPWVPVILGLFAVITVTTIPRPFHPEGEPSVQHVFYYGWLTALSTGLGVLPFVFLPDVPTFWVGISNAVAAGMMLAASYSLFVEGCTHDDPHDTSTVASEIRTGIGALLGLGFILATKNILDKYEDLKVGVLGGTDARKALLIFFVMTLHSFSEGVGIGVSFGGAHGSDLGVFISASLAVHNVPEGLAIAVVLLPRGVSIVTSTLWIICTSLPQPLMAVPAYMFVHNFIPVLPIGLGFAGGAMVWVAVFELLMEAIEDTNMLTTLVVAIPSLVTMLLIQSALDEGTRS